MKFVLYFLILLGSFAFAQNTSEENAQSRSYLGCKAYPKWHYKVCKTDKQIQSLPPNQISNILTLFH